ncbi:MAG: hypothetical protein IPO76_06430 [Elusimicrobia bacterium]|nr:hypothetical protein [Elusimicrobiota bacterium]
MQVLKPKESSVVWNPKRLDDKIDPTKQEEQALKSFHADGRWQWIFYPYIRTALLAGAYSFFLIGIIGAIFFSTRRGQQINAADAATDRPHR